MSTGYELEDDKYELFMEAGTMKMEELGLDPTAENFVKVLKDWYYALTDQALIEQYVTGMKLAKDQAALAELEAAKAALEQEIADLQGGS